MKIAALAVALIGAAVSGCTSVRTNTIETGLFENNPDKTTDAYDALAKKIRDGERPSMQDVECLGFNLKAPNIETLPGTFAFKRIFGDAVFQDQHGVEKPETLVEFSRYRGYALPYQWIETTSDRMYISEYEVFQKGTQLQMFLLFKEDKLCYSELRAVRFDTYYSHRAPLEGLITAIKSPGKAALKLLIKVENYQHPGLEYWVPIPIE